MFSKTYWHICMFKQSIFRVRKGIVVENKYFGAQLFGIIYPSKGLISCLRNMGWRYVMSMVDRISEIRLAMVMRQKFDNHFLLIRATVVTHLKIEKYVIMTSQKNMKNIRFSLYMQSSVPNKRAYTFINFEKKFPPALHGLIWVCTFIVFEKKIPLHVYFSAFIRVFALNVY